MTSAGFSTVFYNKIPEKGQLLKFPYAEIIIEDTQYPLQSNFGSSDPARSAINFKAYFDNPYENGTSANMVLRTQKETSIYQMFYDINFLKALPNINNDFIVIENIIPTTSIHIDINGITNNLILVDYRFDIMWRVV